MNEERLAGYGDGDGCDENQRGRKRRCSGGGEGGQPFNHEKVASAKRIIWS